MACHEVAALRLGLMRILGIDDEAERQHELAELGDAVNHPGPVQSLSQATDLARLQKLYQAALSDLEQKVSRTAADDPKLGYYRALIVLTKKVELDLRNQLDGLTRLYRDLDEMHDFVHEIFPARS
jgi:hypothetical protein